MREGVSAEDCSRKWKALRDRYVREVKKVKARKSGDGAATTYSTYQQGHCTKSCLLLETLYGIECTFKNPNMYIVTAINFMNKLFLCFRTVTNFTAYNSPSPSSHDCDNQVDTAEEGEGESSDVQDR